VIAAVLARRIVGVARLAVGERESSGRAVQGPWRRTPSPPNLSCWR
jgi:hypothetical protein